MDAPRDPLHVDAEALRTLASDPVVRRGIAYFRENRVRRERVRALSATIDGPRALVGGRGLSERTVAIVEALRRQTEAVRWLGEVSLPAADHSGDPILRILARTRLADLVSPAERARARHLLRETLALADGHRVEIDWGALRDAPRRLR